MSALRYNEGKPQWSYVDFKSLEPMVDVLEYGDKKYTKDNISGRDNWKKGLPVRKTCESLLRHIFAYLNGEDNDPESGINHIGHIQCNAMFLGRFHGTEWDDRKEQSSKKTYQFGDGPKHSLVRVIECLGGLLYKLTRNYLQTDDLIHDSGGYIYHVRSTNKLDEYYLTAINNPNSKLIEGDKLYYCGKFQPYEKKETNIST